MNIRALIAVLLPVLLPAAQAAPQVDWLFPIGTQRGSQSLAQIGGKFGWPLKTWADDPGIQIIGEKKNLVRLPYLMNPEYTLRSYQHEGLHWLSDKLWFLTYYTSWFSLC